MLKEIKIQREITPFLKNLKKTISGMNQNKMVYYRFNNDNIIQVSVYKTSKIIFIHVERFPFYDKKVHSEVIGFLSEYKHYDINLWKQSENSYINEDDL